MHSLRAFIDRLSCRTRVAVLIFIVVITTVLILDLEIPS
jgi:hypothetical protein